MSKTYVRMRRTRYIVIISPIIFGGCNLCNTLLTVPANYDNFRITKKTKRHNKERVKASVFNAYQALSIIPII